MMATDEVNLPTKWSVTDNIAWTTQLPGPSAATPIVLGDQVFLSSVDVEGERLLAVCVDRTTGKVLWQKETANRVRQDDRSSYADPSATTDGSRVVFFFGCGDLVCFDLQGEKLWSRNLQDGVKAEVEYSSF